MFLVLCVTTEGNGDYVGGIYRSYEKAEARMKWCAKHCLYGNDAWKIIEVKSQPIKGGFYSDGWSNNIKPGTSGEFGEEPEGE